jgi:hypothetical protein
MNSENYRMDFDERKQYVYDKAKELLEDDEDVFVEACEELDTWDGFLGDIRCEDMDMIDEFFNKPSDLLDKMDDFNSDDSYFYFTAYGYVSTTDNKYTVYSDDYSAEDVLDALIDNYSHVDLREDNRLNELLDVLTSEDFGIEEGWEYDEDMEENDMPEETDDEFTERIDNIY